MTATTALGAAARSTFEIQDATVSALPEGGEVDASSRDRVSAWQETLGPDRYAVTEFLLPRIERDIVRSQPAFAGRQRGHLDLTSEQIKERVDELAPWHVPFTLGHGRVTVRDAPRAAVYQERILFRRDLINGTLTELLGGDLATTTALDIGCNCGFFSLDLATRGAKQVDGIDLRPENIAQARFLAEHYGVDNVSFQAVDAADLEPGRQWDVVLNLGILYHVTDPLQFIRQTYELCRRAAIIDTVCHREPVSAFIMVGERDISSHAEGRESMEFHPTYRAAIDTIRYAGFSEVIEIVGRCDDPHPSYANAIRRCFLAIK